MNDFTRKEPHGLDTPITLPLETNSPLVREQRVLILRAEKSGMEGLYFALSKRNVVVSCADIAELCRQIEAGAGLAIIEKPLLAPEAWAELSHLLARQPVWSDFPLIVLGVGDAGLNHLLLDDAAANVLLLEHPVSLPTLQSAVRGALRGRRQQCELRDRLPKSARTPEELLAQEELAREKNFSDVAINSLPGVFYALDEHGCFLRWNKVLVEVSGYASEEVARMNALNFFAREHQSLVAERIAEVFAKGQAVLDAPLLTKTGGQIPYFFTGIRHYVEGRLCLFGMGVDVTEQKRTEEILLEARDRLSQHAEELEERVAERTRNLLSSIQSLEGVLYHVAHDLRAPLRTMQGFTTILQEECSGLGGDARDYAQRISQASSRMDRLIQDLLAYGRLAHVVFKPVKLGLSHQVDTVLALLADDIQSRKAIVQVENPLLEVRADSAVLEVLLSHLLRNALTFMEPGVTPKVHIRTERLNGNMVRLSIQDNGIGIAREHFDRIFRVFERLETEGVSNHTGIGLAIVRKGAERMGGSAGVESNVGAGSRFWLDLPAA